LTEADVEPVIEGIAVDGSIARKQRQVVVTTGDLKQPYQIIAPVYFQISNKGIFGSKFNSYLKRYSDLIAAMNARRQIDSGGGDFGFLIGEWSAGQSDFDKAFFIAVQVLKERTARLKGDAVICMRQDVDIDSTDFQFFYMQMYGTAVKILESPREAV